VKGRKRHVAVDTSGLLLGVVVHAADLQDADGAWDLLRRIKRLYCWLQAVFADSIYDRVAALLACFLLGLTLIVVRRIAGTTGFVLLPRRWRGLRALAEALDRDRSYNLANLRFEWSAIILRDALCCQGRLPPSRRPKSGAPADGGAHGPTQASPAPGGAGVIRDHPVQPAMPDRRLHPPGANPAQDRAPSRARPSKADRHRNPARR
jgi:hypothetical protein